MGMNEPITLTASLEVQGHWWVPEGTEDRTAGDLQYNPDDGLTLELLGTLADTQPGVDVPIIHGVSKDGAPVSLLRSFSIHLTFGEPSQQSLRCHHALIGTHLPPNDAPSINQIAVHFPGLEEWSCVAPFQHHVADASSGSHLQAVTWQPIEETEAQRIGAPAGTIQVRHTVSSTNDFVTEAHLRHRAYLVLNFDEARGPITAIRLAWALQGLYVLLAGTSLNADEVRLRTTTGEDCSVLGARWSRSARTPLPVQLMPLPFSKVRDSLGDTTGSWFELTQKAKQAVDLFNSVMFHANALLETNFLALAQGLEAFHRSKFPEAAQLPPAEFSAFREHMVSHLPPGLPTPFLDGVVQRLGYFNEPSLRQRIRELLDVVGVPVRRALGIRDKDFVNSVVNVRNALTHSVSHSERPGTVRELFNLNEKMRKLTAILFLLEIGVPADAFESRVRRAW